MTATGKLDAWFASLGWSPFDFQRQVWDAYRAGKSGLIHAATGTGKTLAAFGGPLREALTEFQSSATGLSVLWVTPLRALASDTVDSLWAAIEGVGLDWLVESRTGDTSSSVKNRQRKRLPQVLVTTPESLSLLLTRDDAQAWFADLRCLVVDEWHELLSSKRGVQTELAMARLRKWRPSLQTWGLSATLGNIDLALRVLIGNKSSMNDALIVRGVQSKRIEIDSVIPEKIERFPWAGHLGLTLLPRVIEAVEEANSTLVFTNTRSQTEIWYQAILRERPEWAGRMALHHSSLARKTRDFVEEGLHDGRLKCVVCTSSLDLGVDFSPVDRVLQIGSPKGVARLLQRAGRSGHQPEGVSRVTCVPTNTLELIEVAAAKSAAARGEIEGRDALEKPLDVLTQHVVTVALGGGFDAEELFDEVRTTYAYRDLSRAEWEWVLDFVVRGGESLRNYPDYRRVSLVDDRYQVTDQRVARRHRMSVGTILGEASVQVKYLRGPKLGTVEETFVTRLKKGDRFVFAGKVVELVKLHELTAWVRRTKEKASVVPRWMGGRMPLSSELAGAVREQLQRFLDGDTDSPEMRAVAPILQLQSRRSILPRTNELLIESLKTREGYHLFFYPFEGRLVHEGLSALLAFRLSRLMPITFTFAVNDYGFELLSPTEAPLKQAMENDLFRADVLADDILESLNSAELARRQFREIARVAGLVHPGFPGAGKSAKQLQMSSGLLYDVFSEFEPRNLLLTQARREVLDRQLEYTRLARTLRRLQVSAIRVVQVPKPTPFAFPLLVNRLRESLSSEKLADRVRRMTLELEKE